MARADSKANRPLSPHLQIYRWQATMAASILHRVTGVGLYGGALILAVWLAAAAAGPQAYATANWLLTSWLGILVLIGFTWALFQHMLGGLRHFIWDFGYGLGKPARDVYAVGNFVLALVLTVVFWGIVLWLR